MFSSAETLGRPGLGGISPFVVGTALGMIEKRFSRQDSDCGCKIALRSKYVVGRTKQ